MKIKNRLFMVFLVVVCLIAVGCSATPMGWQDGESVTAPTAMPSPTMPAAPSKGYEEVDMVSMDDVDIERRIVREGHITLIVKDVVESMDVIATIANGMGGYVVSSYKYENDDGFAGEVSIRVPSDEFDTAFDRLRSIADEVPYENTNSRDITEEYIDVEARLLNLEATEEQYLELLEEAKTVEEMLQVQRELSNVRSMIEQLQGRMKYLERTSDMAFISVSLEETGSIAGPWSFVNTIEKAVNGLITFIRGIITVLIWVAIFCWIWIPILVIVIRRRRRAKNKE